jgi:hypothetical protein
MKNPWVVALVLVPITVFALGRDKVPPVSVWYDAPMTHEGSYPPQAPRQQFYTARLDTFVSYGEYLFSQKQAIILPSGGGVFWFFYPYNDDYGHLRTIIFDDSQVEDDTQWIRQDVWEGTIGRSCPTAYWESDWYPEIACHIPGDALYWFMDQGGLGTGLWTPPIEIVADSLGFRVCVVEAGEGNIVSAVLETYNTVFNDYWILFMTFGGPTGGLIVDPLVVFPDTLPYRQGYENTQLLQGQGRIVIATGGYATSAFTDPTNPLLVFIRESTDGGVTWSDAVPVDQTLVPDVPGAFPGINGHWSNSFFDGLIDCDGDLHFMCAVVDSGAFSNASYVHGLYDIHQSNGTWTASLVCDGTYYVNADSTWDPRSFLGGDSYVHAPSLAVHPDGYLYATWADIGHVDPVDSSFTFDIWYTWSWDGGNTWHRPSRVTETPEWDESYPKLIPTTTDRHAYVLTMYEGSSGPMDMIRFPEWHQAEGPTSTGPMVSALAAAPNPFLDEVTLSLSLASACMVEAGVYNARGKMVGNLVNGRMSGGKHSLVWESGEAPPGMYVARVSVDRETLSTRMVLVK